MREKICTVKHSGGSIGVVYVTLLRSNLVHGWWTQVLAVPHVGEWEHVEIA